MIRKNQPSAPHRHTLLQLLHHLTIIHPYEAPTTEEGVHPRDYGTL